MSILAVTRPTQTTTCLSSEGSEKQTNKQTDLMVSDEDGVANTNPRTQIFMNNMEKLT